MNKLNEDMAPVDFLSQEDMCQELTNYCYDLFDENEDGNVNKLGEAIDDIRWDQNVPGLTIDSDDNSTYYLVVNPFFAEKLLERTAQKYQGDWDYNEEEDDYPDQYYELFRFACLWGAYLALVTSTNHINTSNADSYLESWKSNIEMVDREMKQYFSDDCDECFRDFKMILRDFVICRF